MIRLMHSLVRMKDYTPQFMALKCPSGVFGVHEFGLEHITSQFSVRVLQILLWSSIVLLVIDSNVLLQTNDVETLYPPGL